MYRKVCIPLDGSYDAERVLPYMQHLMPLDQSELLLVSNVADTWGEMKGYLHRIAEQYPFAQSHVQILSGDIAESIVNASTEFGADLIAMRYPRRSRISRASLGNIADNVIRTARQPVFLASSYMIPGNDLKRILMPLDGSELSLRALPIAQTIASFADASITLLMVMDQVTAADWDDYLHNRLLKPELVDMVIKAQRMLTGIAEEVPKGIENFTRLAPGKPSQAILDLSNREMNDLIVLSSHGRTGFDRWRYGSVAAELLVESNIPIVVIGRAASI